MSEVEVDKRAKAEEVLGEIVRLMGVKVRLEVKDLPATAAEGDKPAQPASISVALFPEEEIPNLTAGKRSPVADSLQFLVNKIVNRGAEKKWINLGVNGHPEPRPARPARPEPQPKAEKAERAEKAQAPAPSQQPAPRQEKQKQRGQKKERAEGGQRPAAAQVDESQLEVADDPVMQALGRSLAEKSAALGRVYGVVSMTPEQRVQVARGAKGIADVSTKVEGEGRHRRLVFIPSNPKPMPKKSAMPDYDDEEDDFEE